MCWCNIHCSQGSLQVVLPVVGLNQGAVAFQRRGAGGVTTGMQGKWSVQSSAQWLASIWDWRSFIWKNPQTHHLLTDERCDLLRCWQMTDCSGMIRPCNQRECFDEMCSPSPPTRKGTVYRSPRCLTESVWGFPTLSVCPIFLCYIWKMLEKKVRFGLALVLASLKVIFPKSNLSSVNWECCWKHAFFPIVSHYFTFRILNFKK